jgi:putative endonuclease
MYYVYIVTCRDRTLYIGITTDVKKRVDEHNKGMGAKYTRSRVPVFLSYSKKIGEKGGALKEEYRLKQLSRPQKLALIKEAKKKKAKK